MGTPHPPSLGLTFLFLGYDNEAYRRLITNGVLTEPRLNTLIEEITKDEAGNEKRSRRIVFFEGFPDVTQWGAEYLRDKVVFIDYRGGKSDFDKVDALLQQSDDQVTVIMLTVNPDWAQQEYDGLPNKSKRLLRWGKSQKYIIPLKHPSGEPGSKTTSDRLVEALELS